MTNRWEKRRLARLRWSRNAVRAKARKRLQPPECESHKAGKVFIPRRRRADLKVNLERADGGRIQFTLHYFYEKLIGNQIRMSPKQFGRRLGEIFEIWMQP